jgi:hypothetical protein
VSTEDPSSLMRVTLMMAVPIWVGRLNSMREDLALDEAIRWARDAADVVASRGAVIQHRDNRPEEVAAMFNVMARGIAALSGAPGGIHFLNTLWCAAHHEMGIYGRHLRICPDCLADPDPQALEDMAELAEIRDVMLSPMTLQPNERYL